MGSIKLQFLVKHLEFLEILFDSLAITFRIPNTYETVKISRRQKQEKRKLIATFYDFIHEFFSFVRKTHMRHLQIKSFRKKLVLYI